MRAILVGALALAAVTGGASADFVVTGAPPPSRVPEPPPPSAVPRFRMAYGFGDHVPLDFACRQIVPRAIRVRYGPGANPHAVVSWKGGDTWNHVLRDAVKPLGLHLVMTTMAVEIRK